jgi:predicted RNase H-like HicB family nuclease
VSTPQVQIVHIEAKLAWQAHRDPESGTWVAVCQPLNLNATGTTWAELQEMGNQAMSLLFSELLESGELPAFLRRQGWQTTQPLPRHDGNVQFDVPAGWQQAAGFEQLVAH